MIQNLLLNFNLLLAQTEQEKKLTLLYVSLFVFLCLLLFIDTREMKKYVGGNKTLGKIILAVLILAIIVLVVLYFVL